MQKSKKNYDDGTIANSAYFRHYDPEKPVSILTINEKLQEIILLLRNILQALQVGK